VTLRPQDVRPVADDDLVTVRSAQNMHRRDG
jgi:hypothetical protein